MSPYDMAYDITTVKWLFNQINEYYLHLFGRIYLSEANKTN